MNTDNGMSLEFNSLVLLTLYQRKDKVKGERKIGRTEENHEQGRE
jgi:hypothetical protein